MTLDLVRTHGGELASARELAEIRRHLPELVEREDLQTLDEIALRAKAVELYERHRHQRVAANSAARLKIECEAGIGIIDIRRRPWGFDHEQQGRLGPLVIGDRTISPGIRQKWRRVGVGSECGLLDSVLDEIEGDQDAEITTNSVIYELTQRGAGWVDPRPLRQRLAKLNSEGVTATEVARRAGIDRYRLHTLMRERGKRMNYAAAREIAVALGIDPSSLKPVPYRKRATKKLPPRVRRAKAVKGDYARAYQLIRLVQEEINKRDGSGGNDELWAALHLAEDVIAAKAKGGYAVRRALATAGSRRRQAA